MNVSMIQTLQPTKIMDEQTSEAKANNGLFGAVLLQSMETASVKEASSNNSKLGLILSAATVNTDSNPMSNEATIDNSLHSLLDFLRLEDIAQLDNGKQLMEELLVATQDQQLSVIFEHVGNLFSSESLEELQSLLSEQTNGTGENFDLLQQLSMIVNLVINEGNITHQRILSVDEGIKLAKIYTLFQNVLDLSADDVMKFDELKQKLEQLTVKLESILVPKEKSALELMMNKNNAAVFNGQLFNSDYTKMQTSVQSTINNTSDSIAAISTISTNSEAGTGSHNPFMNMSKLEQFVLNTQLSDKGTVNSEQLLKSFENIIRKAQFTNQNGMKKLLIKLNPEHLGSLHIEIIQQNGTMIAKIIASTQQAKELLDHQLQGLKQAFVNQNIPVEKLELSQQFSNLSQERNLTREQGQQQSGGQSSSDKSQEDEQALEQFQSQFEEALLEEKGAGDSDDFD